MRVAQGLGELDRVVAGVEDEPGQSHSRRQVRQEGGDLLGGHRVAVLLGLLGTPPPHRQGRGPTLPDKAELRDPGLRPAGDDGLPGRMARGVVVDGPTGTGLGVRARPDADIHRVDRLAACQGMAGQQVLQRGAGDLANR